MGISVGAGDLQRDLGPSANIVISLFTIGFAATFRFQPCLLGTG
jgi:hypothetical protein